MAQDNNSSGKDKSFSPESDDTNKITNNTGKNTASANQLLHYAKFYHEKGLNVIPVVFRDKKPALDWKEYQERRSTEEEIERWFSSGKYNIGVVCGKTSGNLFVIDIDASELWEKWNKQLLNEPEINWAVFGTWVHKSGKGVHIVFRAKDFEPKSGVLIQRPHVDILAEGKIVVVPPSVHPSGAEYSFIYGIDNLTGGIKDVVSVDKVTYEKIVESLKRTAGVPIERELKEEQRTETVVNGLKVLQSETLVEIKDLVKPAYDEGYRQSLILFLAGWFAKARIHPLAVVQIAKWLHDETQDKDKMEERVGAIVYTYKKEGIDVDRFKKEIKQIAGIKKYPGEDREIERGAIKGYTGVQEILESQLGVEHANKVMLRLEQLLGVQSPYAGDNIYYLENEEKGLYIVNDLRTKQIYRKRINEEVKGQKRGEILLEASFSRVVVYESLIKEEERLFEVTVVSKSLNEPLQLPPLTIDQISVELRKKGLVTNRRMAEDTITKILNEFIQSGRAETKSGTVYPGFFWAKKELVPNRIVIKDVPAGELREALALLNELADKWFLNVIDKFATVIKWGIVAPFVFARKQITKEQNLDLRVPDLILQGERDTAKTTLGEIVSIYMWNMVDGKRSFSVGEVNTEATFRDRMSLDTFPRVINEANALFEKMILVNMEKTKVDDTVLGGRYYDYVNYRTKLALSPVVFTLNPKPRIDFDELELVPKTALLLEFTAKEIVTERKDEFNSQVRPNLHKLGMIGHWVSKFLLEHQELIKTNWVELAERLLKEMYKFAGMEAPNWVTLNYRTKTYAEILEDKRIGLISEIVNLIKNEYKQHVGGKVDVHVEIAEKDTEYSTKADLKTKLYAITSEPVWGWIIRKDDTFYITPLIRKYLKDYQVANLKDLAELLGIEDKYYEKKSLKVKNDGKTKVKNNAAIILSVSELLELLKADADFMS